MARNVVTGHPNFVNTRVNLWDDARSFRRLTIRRVWIEKPFSRRELDVYWLPSTHRMNMLPKGFNIYRSQSPKVLIGQASADGPLNGIILVTVPMYRDVGVNIENFEVYYYVVTQVLQDDSEIAIEEPVCLDNYVNSPNDRRHVTLSMPRIFQEYKRRKHIILANDAEIVDLLIRKQSGARCACYDPSYESLGQSNCAECYGTGWVGGYDRLSGIYMRVYSIKETLQRQPEGLKLKSTPTGWIVDFPVLRAGDIVVRRNGERLEISNVDFNMHQGVLTEQGFDLFLYEPTHVIYTYGLEGSRCQSV